MSCMNMDNDSTAAAASMSANNNDVDDITNDMSKVVVSDNVICGTCTETSSEQKLEEHIKSDEIVGDDASGSSSTGIDIMSGTNDVEICANCGKEDAKNTCNKCKSVKYCNAACKKKHRSKHKKDCGEEIKRVAELRDKELFKQPPTIDDDCPICFLRLPFFRTGRRYKSCCGKFICCGCINALQKRDDHECCPFCRTPTPRTDDEVIKRQQKRVKFGDAEAMTNLGKHYTQGMDGLPQDWAKAIELWTQAEALGHVAVYYTIGNACCNGDGVERDMKKAIYYWEKGAMGGCTHARYNLGVFEHKAGNMQRALKHYKIAVDFGCNDSLKVIQDLYSKGKATKDEYSEALRAYQKYLDEVKSTQRDEAAAAREDFKYIA